MPGPLSRMFSFPGAPNRLLVGVAVLATLLMFVWSIVGTIALRNTFILWVLVALPFLHVDRAHLRRSLCQGGVIALTVLTGWIVIHNLFFAWDAARSWYESVQWFKAILCLLLGVALMCAPREADGRSRWQIWIVGACLAWALHLVLNVLLKDYGSQSILAALQAPTLIGSRDMVSYLGTGLLAVLLADVVTRLSHTGHLLPLGVRSLWAALLGTILLTTATMTRNALPVMAVEIVMAIAAIIGASATRTQKLRRGGMAAGVLVLIVVAAWANLKLDSRWNTFADSARIAWDIDHNNWWIDQVKNPRPLDAEGVQVEHSAYNRIAWMRGACRMIATYPMGVGYDRNAFRRSLMKYYGAANTASGHAHAGIFDFTLATGLPGGFLLVASMLLLIGTGWRRWRRERDASGLALAIFVASYLLRAAVDGIVRDHMLEQAMFVIGLLLAANTTGEHEGTQ